MGGLHRICLPSLAVLLSVFVIAACGGDDGTNTSSTSSATNAGESSGTSGGGSNSAGADREDETSDESSSESSTSQGGDSPSHSQPKDFEPPDRGEVSAQSEGFQKYSAKGKLHLAEFGEEAAGGDREAVQKIVGSYLDAVAAGEWSEACNYLLTETRAQVIGLSPDAGDCPTALRRFVEGGAGGTDSQTVTAPEGIASLRLQSGGPAGEGAGFALFHASNGEDLWVAVKKRDGSWRILSANPQAFR